MSPDDEFGDFLTADLHSRSEVLANRLLVPAEPGVYGWWFRELPAQIDTTGCKVRDHIVPDAPAARMTLLYTGISPKEPPKNGRPPSQASLNSRIITHYTGNAEGSTLRLTLGCLLSDRLGLELRRFGSGNRRHFGVGEQILSRWMDKNAYVSWHRVDQPWELEKLLIARVDLPLNLDQNQRNAFHAELKERRRRCAERAKSLPILPNPGVGGSSID